MVVRIGICDDEAAACNLLATACLRYADRRNLAFEFAMFRSGQELLGNLGALATMQVLFLDISMDGINGMEAARKIHESGLDDAVRIVFVTSMVQYAVEGYSVHAFGFLPKPITQQSIDRILDDALASISSTAPKNIAIRTSDGSTHVILSNSIMCVESSAHHTKIATTSGSLSCSASLKELETELADAGFFRCHRCYLVNLQHITRIDADSCLIATQDRIPISRQRKQDFLTAFNRYMGMLL